VGRWRRRRGERGSGTRGVRVGRRRAARRVRARGRVAGGTRLLSVGVPRLRLHTPVAHLMRPHLAKALHPPPPRGDREPVLHDWCQAASRAGSHAGPRARTRTRPRPRRARRHARHEQADGRGGGVPMRGARTSASPHGEALRLVRGHGGV
jgi:hypothetical protein